jgi:hypothetical protein
MDWKDRAEQLVSDHWDYHDKILPIFMPSTLHEFFAIRANWGIWYKEIGKHFYKHAIEDVKAGKIEF